MAEKVSPAQVQRFLKGVDYPASKEDLIAIAEQEGADENVRSILEQLPDVEYSSPVEVSEGLGSVI
jgi:hypothetical protein